MQVKTYTTDSVKLEAVVNEIGWENILQILPEHCYNGTLFVILYIKTGEDENGKL